VIAYMRSNPSSREPANLSLPSLRAQRSNPRLASGIDGLLRCARNDADRAASTMRFALGISLRWLDFSSPQSNTWTAAPGRHYDPTISPYASCCSTLRPFPSGEPSETWTWAVISLAAGVRMAAGERHGK
jgi:hypothetical protein